MFDARASIFCRMHIKSSISCYPTKAETMLVNYYDLTQPGHGKGCVTAIDGSPFGKNSGPLQTSVFGSVTCPLMKYERGILSMQLLFDGVCIFLC